MKNATSRNNSFSYLKKRLQKTLYSIFFLLLLFLLKRQSIRVSERQQAQHSTKGEGMSECGARHEQSRSREVWSNCVTEGKRGIILNKGVSSPAEGRALRRAGGGEGLSLSTITI